MKKRLAFLSLGLVVGLAGVATASAFVLNGTATSSIDGGLDQGLILNWGDTAKIADVKDLQPGLDQIREIKLAAPVKSETVGGSGQLSFVLADAQNVPGLQIEVSSTNWGNPDVPVNVVLTLDSTDVDGEITIDLNTWTTNMSYFVRFSIVDAPSTIDETGAEETPEVNAGATLTVSLGYLEPDSGAAGGVGA